LQRLRWTGKLPFEILEMKAVPGGFALHLTKPVSQAGLAKAQFKMSSYTYELHAAYGSKEFLTEEHELGAPKLAEDGKSIFLPVAKLRAGYVHELHVEGLADTSGLPLLHREAYYTLIRLPR
jgi:hypothetical protein